MSLIVTLYTNVTAQNETLRVHFIPVGYGDAILIDNAPGNTPRRILIDTGKEKKGKYIYKYLKKRKLLPLDWVIITHPHPDHYGGLAYLLKKIDIQHVYWNGQPDSEKDFQKILKDILIKKIPISILKRGDTLSLGTHGTLTCLHPEDLSNTVNNNSLVFNLTFEDTSFLFTGDIGIPVQNKITLDYPEILSSISVLKLPHHGDILSASFSSAVNHAPFAILTVGKNKHKNPNIQTLKTFGNKLLRTDYCIDIVLESDGTTVKRIPPKKK